ncbi:MAG: hypothetical protein H0T17_05415 [Propionibacteriales bacterium]|nr:hypothetical protein [Propionibacteriales bacterium]
MTIEERDGNVSTSADTVKASRHQEIMFIVSSDSADEFHVHSEPEHEFEVKAAKPRSSASPSTPAGQYPVESHELGITVLKLQIS